MRARYCLLVSMRWTDAFPKEVWQWDACTKLRVAAEERWMEQRRPVSRQGSQPDYQDPYCGV